MKKAVLIQKMYWTDRKYFSPAEVSDNFAHLANSTQLDIIMNHLADLKLCHEICGVALQDDKVYFCIDEKSKELILVSAKQPINKQENYK